MKKFSDFIKKSAEPQKKEPASNVIKGRFKIAKSDDDKHLAFGWANVAIRADGEEIEDWQEDIIEPEELENAAYQYVLLYREGGALNVFPVRQDNSESEAKFHSPAYPM